MLRRLKLWLYSIWYPLLCIDNANLGKANKETTHVFAKARLNLKRGPITSTQNQTIEAGTDNQFLPSAVTVFESALIDPPYGLAYTKSGKLICPPNWPMRMLLDGLPIKNHLSPTNPQSKEVIDSAFYLIGPGTFNYYHWITDKLTCIPEFFLYREQHNPNLKLLAPKNAHGAYYEMLHRLGIQTDDLIQWDHAPITVEQLVMPFANKSMNHHAINNPDRLLQLRNELLPASQRIKTNKRLFISRKDAPKHRSRIANEDQVWALLEQAGFESAQLTGVSLDQQIELFQTAEVVIAPHGAGLTNLLFCQAGTRVIELLPSSNYPRYYKDLCDTLGVDHFPVFITKNEDGQHSLNLDQFEALLNQLKLI